MSTSAFPIRLADRMAQLPEYLFENINKLQEAKKKAGHDVIDLGMGNPKDPTPQPIVDKLAEVAQDRRNHRYSKATGIYSLRKELAKYYADQFDVALDPAEEVICTIGSKEGFSHLSLALLGPGDRAVVPAPSYPIHTYSVVLAGGEPLRLPVEDDEEYLRGLAHLCEEASVKPKVVFLNYPHNPTGHCVEIPFFEEVIRIAKRHEVEHNHWIIRRARSARCCTRFCRGSTRTTRVVGSHYVIVSNAIDHVRITERGRVLD